MKSEIREEDMILVKIGGFEREFDGNARWVQEQFDGRRNEGQSVCVRVTIKCGDIDFTLSTPGCGGGGGGMGRSFTAGEEKALELWRDAKLDNPGFTSGNVVSFLQRLKRLC